MRRISKLVKMEKLGSANLKYFSNVDTTPEEREEASKLKTFEKKAATSSDLFNLPSVEIDEDAKQKYVLFKVDTSNETKYLVRGKKTATYHKDAAFDTIQQLKKHPNVTKYEIIGGGRIVHSTERNLIQIYGYSYGFPWIGNNYLHHISAKAVAEGFPEFTVEPDNTVGLY